MNKASPRLQARAYLGLLELLLAMGLFLFLPAGTWAYVHAWTFLAVFFGCALAVTLYLVGHDPALLERRVQAGPVSERRGSQKVIQALASLAFLSILVVPALDHRFEGTQVGPLGVALGHLLVVCGFAVVFLAFRANSFASGVIEVGQEQRVVDTGPYALVRHPMYSGALVLLIGIPLALGSFWGLVTLVPFTGILVWRLLDEEAFLSRQLPGYDAYRSKVRYRLIPGIW